MKHLGINIHYIVMYLFYKGYYMAAWKYVIFLWVLNITRREVLYLKRPCNGLFKWLYRSKDVSAEVSFFYKYQIQIQLNSNFIIISVEIK